MIKKLKNMTVVSNEIETIKEYYNSSILGECIILKDNIEVDYYKIKSLNFGNIIVLKVHPDTTPKDMIGFLKSNHNLDVIVLENSIDKFDDEYIVFDEIEDMMDFIIEKNESYKLLDITVELILSMWETRDDEDFKEKVHKIYELSGDAKVYPKAVRDIFIF